MQKTIISINFYINKYLESQQLKPHKLSTSSKELSSVVANFSPKPLDRNSKKATQELRSSNQL
jgi:hypothetical protein